MQVGVCACGCGGVPLRRRKYIKGHRPLKPTAQGYRRIYRPGHPMANRDGNALEHRVVLCDAGVLIPKGWNVHHKNGDKLDNRLENLQVMPKADHHRLHVRAAGFVINQYGVWPLREAAA